MAVGLGLLVLPALLPASHSTVNGARIWVRFGGFSFQPGEIAKLALEVFFAGYLVRKRDVLALAGRRILGMTLPRGRDLGPVLVAWGASLLILTRESDLGSSLLFFGIFVAMLYVATERRSWLLIGILLFVAGSLFAFHTIGHVHDRVEIWLHPLDPQTITDQSYQLAQGLFGQATGGIFGTGLGQGRPDLVPFANTDFIASTIAEELGLAGLMAVLVDLPADRDARPTRGDRHPRRLRQAARRRAGVRARAAGLRPGRRRHAADPAHRSDAAVPVLRRIEPGLQLDAARPADPDQRRRPATRTGAPCRPGRGRDDGDRL